MKITRVWGVAFALLVLTGCPLPKKGSSTSTPVPTTGYKAEMLVHEQHTGYAFDWPGAVFFTKNQVRVQEFGSDGQGVVREYLSDNGAFTFYRFAPPQDKGAWASWLKGGSPLPGSRRNAWVGELPFCAIGQQKDFVLAQLKASPAITITSLGTQTIRGEVCEGIRYTVTGPDALNMPGETPPELWFSNTYGVVWQVNSSYGSDRRTVGIQNVQPWTPVEAMLKFPSNYSYHDWRD